MRRWTKTVNIASIGLLSLGMLFTSPADAAQTTKQIEATYNNIKIVNNGKTVTIDPQMEPFIYNNTTYIPLRMMGELYNKNVSWNGETSTITITDTTTAVSQATINSLTTQINEKNVKIAQLEAELKELKQKLEKEMDIDDLEDQLNDDYEDYDDLDDIEISLSGDEDEIDIRVEVDKADWKDFSNREQEDFLQDIIDDILDEYEDADIAGTVKDADDGDLLATFDTDSDGDVDLEEEEADLDDLEDELNDDYGDYDDIDDIDISLDGDEDDIDITIEVDGDDWDDLEEDDKLDFLQDIVDDILDEYEDAFIDGRIEDADSGSRLDTFYADGEEDDDVTID